MPLSLKPSPAASQDVEPPAQSAAVGVANGMGTSILNATSGSPHIHALRKLRVVPPDRHDLRKEI
jgi:hypothetical protein